MPGAFFVLENDVEPVKKLQAKKLPFAKGHTIIPKLFLKNPPVGNQENVLLPDDLIKYL